VWTVDRVTVDASDAKRLAATFGDAVEHLPADTRAVVQRGAWNIKRDAQRAVTGHPHLPHYPQAITYDTEQAGDTVTAEIGPDKTRRQGPLGNVLEYGSPTRPPIPHLGPALQNEQPRFEKALGDAAVKSLGER
jgi:hypothetical protein